MSGGNQSCGSSKEDLQSYQHQVYVVVYAIIFSLGLPCNLLALWVFRRYVKETKKAVLFMMNLALADLMQVLSLPLRIYYYQYNIWPFGQPLCIFCFYLKYVNMYASIFFMACISLRRCELNMHPLKHRSSKKKGDLYICALGWLLVFLCCIPFPLLRTPNLHQAHLNNEASGGALVSAMSPSGRNSISLEQVCFTELPMHSISRPAFWTLLILAELLGFIVPLVLVLVCACLNVASLRSRTEGVMHDRREQRRAMRMVMSCLMVFLVCFVPYHVTFPLDFMEKVGTLDGSCSLRELVLRSHPVTLCLASFNSSLDPIMYYLTTNEFWRLGRNDGRHAEKPSSALP
ncbi:unnamed protein product [Lota lota]